MGFAVDIVNLYKHLVHDKKEYVISKQILKSETSIGANLTSNYFVITIPRSWLMRWRMSSNFFFF